MHIFLKMRGNAPLKGHCPPKNAALIWTLPIRGRWRVVPHPARRVPARAVRTGCVAVRRAACSQHTQAQLGPLASGCVGGGAQAPPAPAVDPSPCRRHTQPEPSRWGSGGGGGHGPSRGAEAHDLPPGTRCSGGRHRGAHLLPQPHFVGCGWLMGGGGHDVARAWGEGGNARAPHEGRDAGRPRASVLTSRPAGAPGLARG